MTKRRSREEQQFLDRYDATQFPQLSVAVDIVLLTTDGRSLRALLIKRDQFPDRGRWSLPGGFVAPKESLEDCAARILKHKAQLEKLYLEQLYTFGNPDRDSRTRVLSVAYFALVPATRLTTHHRESLRWLELEVPWKGETGGPVYALDENRQRVAMAFDHAEILGLTIRRLRGKLGYVPIGFELLPKQFTLRQLQQIHETILGRSLNKDSFRRKTLASGLVKATGKLEQAVGHRPAELYRFTRKPARSPDGGP